MFIALDSYYTDLSTSGPLTVTAQFPNPCVSVSACPLVKQTVALMRLPKALA